MFWMQKRRDAKCRGRNVMELIMKPVPVATTVLICLPKLQSSGHFRLFDNVNDNPLVVFEYMFGLFSELLYLSQHDFLIVRHM